ncbi:glycoside hydrolase family 2 TIM barrel-domain containing protein [Sphingomonas solaris]|uniref:Glycoside hydrolase family 2 protein n=1 Tax=Alterirhizorhabdus solaris TaxID=2529389 RepID=A0A558RB48_9SPHN|nr:glycoside hydrolase family 2 TIM barrel-domain containing protein [Sphingomonas solaris]TVV76610.1 glycoside hydrolase family 2 protein [Sphingomonas solaris]
MTQQDSELPRRHVLKAAALGGVALTLGNAVDATAATVRADTAGGPARDLLFDTDWRFFLGDAAQAQNPTFDDTGWRKLDLPHDWSIEDRPGAPKTTDPWVPPVALWNPGPHPKGAPVVSPEVPIVMASVPPASPDGPPHKVGPFDTDATAFGWGTGWTVGGIGWYRKHFTLTPLVPGEQVEIRFDGAYMIAEAWINGVSLGRNVNGYLGFVFDLTPHLRADGANVLAVRVSNVGETARWYSGSGLYRHVWLSRTGAVRVPYSGTAITTPKVAADAATVLVGVEVENRATRPETVTCQVALRDTAGRVVATAVKPVSLAAGQAGRVDVELSVPRPALWSPDAPNLHHADITLTAGGKTTDRISERFGIRTIAVSPKAGFQVNGKTYQLQGACVHHDHGMLGAVAIDRAERRKVELMKANGFNAIRCSHNPPSPYFLDVCDELGMIVMDEAFDMWEKPKLMKDAYHLYFKDHWRADLTSMIRRDRNHASIAFWSIGNEINEAISPRGVEIATQMRGVIRAQDTTRFITQALTASYAGEKGKGARAQLDVTSYNYSFNAVEKDHATYPDLSFLTTETHSADAYDIREHMERIPAYMGEFVWTGMDYIGEVGSGSSRLRSDTAPPDSEKKIIFGMDVSMLNFYVWDYPAYQAGSGEIDLIGLKKPPSVYRDVVWGRTPLALFVQRPVPQGYHEEQTAWGWPDVLESWTWPAGDARPMAVHVYSTGDEVALLLNGKEVGRKALAPADKCKVVLKVPYQPGKLVAVAYKGGREIGRRTLETVGAPARLKLRAERSRIAGSAADLGYVFAEVCDAQGRPVPDAAVPLTFEVAGKAMLRAAGSANPYGIESFQDGLTRSFHGTALAILQPTGRRGDAQVRVSSPGLQSASLSIQVG